MKPMLLACLVILFYSNLQAMNCVDVFKYLDKHQVLDYDMVDRIQGVTIYIGKEQNISYTDTLNKSLRLLSAKVLYPSEFSEFEVSIKRSIAKANIMMGRVRESNPDLIDFKLPDTPLYSYKFSLPFSESLKTYITILLNPINNKIIYYKKSFNEHEI